MYYFIGKYVPYLVMGDMDLCEELDPGKIGLHSWIRIESFLRFATWTGLMTTVNYDLAFKVSRDHVHITICVVAKSCYSFLNVLI